MPGEYPLPSSDPASLGFAAKPLDHLDRLIKQHIEEGRYPGAQIALARHGQLALFRTYGNAKVEPTKVPATNDNLFLLFSQTKVLTSSAVWTLVEEGKLSFMDKIADHLPEFAARGKADITLQQVMTHQGGFPSNNVTKATWTDHARMRAEVCDFALDWTPGSKLQYHGQAAHLVQAMVIEAVTGQDYRDVIRDKVIAPLGLDGEIFVGVPTQSAVALRRYLCAGAARQLRGVPCRRAAEWRRLCHRARHGGVLSDAARQGAAGQCAAVLAAADRLRLAQSHRRARRRADERHPDASRPGPACARRERSHPRSRHARRTRRRSDMAASVRRIPGPTRRAACRSPISPTSSRRIRGIRRGWIAWPTWCTRRSTEQGAHHKHTKHTKAHLRVLCGLRAGATLCECHALRVQR